MYQICVKSQTYRSNFCFVPFLPRSLSLPVRLGSAGFFPGENIDLREYLFPIYFKLVLSRYEISRRLEADKISVKNIFCKLSKVFEQLLFLFVHYFVIDEI